MATTISVVFPRRWLRFSSMGGGVGHQSPITKQTRAASVSNLKSIFFPLFLVSRLSSRQAFGEPSGAFDLDDSPGLLPALGRVFSEVSDFDEAWNSERTSISPLAHSLSSAALPLKVRLLLLLLLGLQRAMSLAAKRTVGQ
jgi:hypothetical protein